MSDGGLTMAVEWERTLDDLLDRTSKFPKSMRYVLGARIDDAAIDVAVLLVDARFTKTERRRRTLEELNLRLNRLRVLVRLAHQRRCLDHGAFEHVVRGLDAFGRGLGAWLKQAAGSAA